jgi:hypothetical protein
MKRSSVTADGETSPRLDDVRPLAAENHPSGIDAGHRDVHTQHAARREVVRSGLNGRMAADSAAIMSALLLVLGLNLVGKRSAS